MTLEIVIPSLKIDLLGLYSTYFETTALASTELAERQREYLKALDIYIQTLEYYNGVDSDLTTLTELDVFNVVEAATTAIRTFPGNYYDD